MSTQEQESFGGSPEPNTREQIQKQIEKINEQLDKLENSDLVGREKDKIEKKIQRLRENKKNLEKQLRNIDSARANNSPSGDVRKDKNNSKAEIEAILNTPTPGGSTQESLQEKVKGAIEILIENTESLEELIKVVEDNIVEKYFGENKSLILQRLKHAQSILNDDSLDDQKKRNGCALVIGEFEHNNRIGHRLHGLVTKALPKEKSLKSDEKVDVQTLENDEMVEKNPEFEKVKKEIQGAESFEEMYEILEKYKNDISGDIDTEGDALERIKSAVEVFKKQVQSGSLTKENIEKNRILTSNLPKRFIFKGRDISIYPDTWKRCILALMKEEQSTSVDSEPLEKGEGQDISPDSRRIEINITATVTSNENHNIEDVYTILGKYKDYITGDPAKGMSFENVLEEIQNQFEYFRNHVRDYLAKGVPAIHLNKFVDDFPHKNLPEIFIGGKKSFIGPIIFGRVLNKEFESIQNELESKGEDISPDGGGVDTVVPQKDQKPSEEKHLNAEKTREESLILDAIRILKDEYNNLSSRNGVSFEEGLRERRRLLSEIKELERQLEDLKNSPQGEVVVVPQEDQKPSEELAREFEQNIRRAKSLGDLIERVNSYQGEIVDGENTFSKEDIKGTLTALSVSIATQGPDAPKPSENEQYQSDFFEHIPQTLQETVKKLADNEWEEKTAQTPKATEKQTQAEVGKKDGDGEKLEPQEVQGDHEEIKPGHNLIPVSSGKEMIAKEKKDEEGDFLRELTKELDDARREYAQDIYNGEKKKRYNDVLVRYNTEVSSRFGEFIGEKEFEQLVRANEIQEQLAIKDIRAEHLIEKAPLWEKGKSFLKDRVKQWKDLSLKQKVLVSASIVGVGGAGILTGSAILGAGALVAGTAVRAVSFAATSSGFKGILESYSKKLYEGAERERMEQARSLFRENEYGSDSQEQRVDNITRLLAQSAEKQASRARKRRLERHARTAVALAGALTLVMASRCLGQTAVDALDGYFGGPLEGSGGVTEPQGKIDIGIEKEPIAYDKDYIFPDKPPQEYVPEIKTIEVPIERTPEEYIQAHPEMFREISERKWMDNNTSLQVGANGRITGADLNELNLRWGGGGDGIDANGNYVFDVAKMTPEGSFHKDLSVDAREAIQKGQLKMLFTLDGNTQSYGIEVPVRPDGSVVIDPHSPEGKLLFQTVGEGADTRLELKGKFAEVGVIGEDGKFTVLATHKGVGLEGISDVIEKEITVPPQIDQEIPPVEQGAKPVGGGGETMISSEDVITGDEQGEAIPPITTEPTVPEEPVVPLGKEPPLERVIIGPGEVAVLGLAGMGARKIHKARGGGSQLMIPAPVRRPEVTPSSAPLELEGKKDGEKIIASLRDYKEYEKGLSPEEKKKIENTLERVRGAFGKTQEEFKKISAQEFNDSPVGRKLKNTYNAFVELETSEESDEVRDRVRKEMIDLQEGETAYEYVRRIFIQRMILTREYK